MSEKTTQWIEIDPCDTLFFKGTESMVAGENHEARTMFPPMPTTLTGAIRTALLAQHGITPKHYRDNPEQCQQLCPQLGKAEKPGFSITGPLLLLNATVLYPAPAHWMANIDDPKEDGAEITVQAGKPLATRHPDTSEQQGDESRASAAKTVPGLQTKNQPGLCGSVARPFWIMRPVAETMKPLTGYWVTAPCFAELASGKGTLVLRNNLQNLAGATAELIPAPALFQREERVGIALNRNRTVKDGHLYATQHVRLSAGVKLLVAMVSEHPCALADTGILQLGGEQRMCTYRLVSAPELPERKTGQYYYTLSPLPYADLPDTLQGRPRASGKLLRIGGWDMQKGFHKPLSAWFPAGTVITKNQQDNQQDSGQFLTACITI